MKVNDIYVLVLGGEKFKDSRIKHVHNTWLNCFPNYLISCDGKLDDNMRHAVVTKHNNWHSCPPKIFKGLELIVNEKSDCSWVFIADDDTFVNVVNLVAFTGLVNVKKHKMYGKDMTGNYPYGGGQIKYLSGGGGTLLPMHVATAMLKKAKEENWFEWLCWPRQIPPKHQGDYPTSAGADTKLGWLGNQIGVEQGSYPHLFHPEGYKKYDHDPRNILQCITYHRQYGDKQKMLNDIVFEDIKKNKIDLNKVEIKKIKQQKPAVNNVQANRNTQASSYYMNTELLLLRKKIERLEKQFNKSLK